jgi:hypothetical protein
MSIAVGIGSILAAFVCIVSPIVLVAHKLAVQSTTLLMLSSQHSSVIDGIRRIEDRLAEIEIAVAVNEAHPRVIVANGKSL